MIRNGFLALCAALFLTACNGTPTRQANLSLLNRDLAEGEFTYDVTVLEIPPASDRVEIWVPLPSSNAYQKIDGLKVHTDWPYEVVKDPEYGNRFARIRLDERVPPQVTVSVTFEFSRTALRGIEDFKHAPGEGLKGGKSRFLKPDSLVPVGGKPAEEAKRVVGDLTDPLEQARALYDHIVATMEYKKGGNGWGRGDALYACDIRKGNCTDFHSLFISEARSLEIPARFVMGFPLPKEDTPSEIGGYHCWAEFYVPSEGWLPVDASEAHKDPEKKDELFAGLDARRISFTTGRDIRVPGLSEPQNYTIYPIVRVDGQPHPKVERRFFFQPGKERVR